MVSDPLIFPRQEMGESSKIRLVSASDKLIKRMSGLAKERGKIKSEVKTVESPMAIDD